MATDCNVTTTLQILDPEGTTVQTTGSRPVADGIEPLIVGQQYVDVTFSESHPESYNFDELEIENTTDNPPLILVVGDIAAKDETGFRVMLNASPDSAFYSLRWRITV